MLSLRQYIEEGQTFKKGDRVKFAAGSDYVEPRDRGKTFVVQDVRRDEVKIDGAYVPSEEVYKI